MKIKYTFLLLLLPVFAFAQADPVLWSVSSMQNHDGSFNINFKGSINDNWYVYSDANRALEIDGATVTYQDSDIEILKPLMASSSSSTITDQVFNSKVHIFKKELILNQTIAVKPGASFLKITINAYASDGTQFLPVSKELTIEIASNLPATNPGQIKLTTIDLNNPIENCGSGNKKEKGLLTIFLLGFIGGLIALLTPCVFPMVPVTVSFFTGRSATKQKAIKNGLLYGTFIFLIYLLASLPFHLLNNINPQILNTISTNAWVNILFFAVFVFFSLSLFGLFEIRLPGSVATRVDAKSNLASSAGIFFMALTLAIVSFSCTGPILGSLLVGSLSSTGGAWQLTAGMGGFGLALALPFALFAMFPQWLKHLPKSGSWMDTLKKSLAFIELALAFKFLSNADLVEHWGILKREVFIAIWLLLSLLLALYLLGVFNKPAPRQLVNADKIKKPLLWPKRVFGLAFLLFTFYLIPGLTQSSYANLKLLSGFAPPLSYSIYGKDNVHGKGIEPDVMNDYEKALKLARKENKPILIDFTGWACVNCRKMEEHVWPVPEIASIIKEKYILVSLYVDDRQKLPVDQRFLYTDTKGRKREITTLGDKWSAFQSENFNYVSQPLYVILSPDQQLMNNPVGYTPSVKEYKKWLQCGLKAYARISNQNNSHSLTKK